MNEESEWLLLCIKKENLKKKIKKNWYFDVSSSKKWLYKIEKSKLFFDTR